MAKAHFVNPPYFPLEADPNQRISVSSDIEKIGNTSEKAFYMTVWDSEKDYVISRAEGFVNPGGSSNFNCVFEMPENRDLWVDIIAGHYTDEWPGFQDDEIYGGKIENTEVEEKKAIIVPLVIFAGIEVLAIAILGTLIKRRKRELKKFK